MKLPLPTELVLRSFLLIFALTLTGHQSVKAQEGLVPDHTEYLTLKDLYISTLGDSWHNTTNWPAANWPATASSAVFGTWFGVTVENGDIVTIGLNGNNLQQTLPASLANLSEIRIFSVGGNALQGGFPEVVFSFSKLEIMDLAYNQFTGQIPSFASAQFNALYLTMGSNGFIGPFPDLSSQTNLYTLSLAYSNFTPGPLPASFGNLTHLTQVYLTDTKRTGSLPDFIGNNLVNMVTLFLDGNQFSGTIPQSIGNLSQLSHLYLNNNQLSGSIPSALDQLDNLAYLYLDNNQLSGSLPTELSGMQNIRGLSFENNQLSGAIPSEFSQLTLLGNLNVIGNQLTVLPDLSNLTLGALQLSNNKFSGPFPAWIASETSLTFLRLAGNQFSGQLPANFGSLVNMYDLTLDHNQFTGSFPDISTWNNLFGLNISNNGFTGDFPDVPSNLGIIDITSNHFTTLSTSLFSINNNYYSLLYYNDIKEIRNLATDIANGAIHPKNSGYFNLSYNQLDFSQLSLLKQIPNVSIVDLPQNEIKDITRKTFTLGSELLIPSRQLSATSSITWEKRANATSEWIDVTSLSEDPSKRTFKRAATTVQDEGEYRWRMRDSQYTEAWHYIQSVAIVVKEERNNVFDVYAFQYKYDGKRRMTHKKIPGADWIYMVYDNRNRLVLTQDGNQRLKNQWMYTKYDALNRPVMAGMYTHSSGVDQATMQGVVNSYYSSLTQDKAWFETFMTSSGHIMGYDNKSFPQITANEPLSVTYYDNYDFKTLLEEGYDYANAGMTPQLVNGATYPQPEMESTAVIGQLTGTRVRNLASGAWMNSVSYYDDKYRLIQSVADNDVGGTDRTTNIVDFVGKTLTTQTIHVRNNFTWNNPGWITATSSSISYTGSGAAGTITTVQQLAAGTNGYVEFTAGTAQNTTSVWLGGGNDYINLAEGFYSVLENGVTQASGYFAAGDVFRIERVAGAYRYYVRNNLVYTATAVSTTAYPLSVDLNRYQDDPSALVNLSASFAQTSMTTERTLTYDHAGRLLKTHHSVDGATPVLLAENKYNELGQLVDKNLYSTDGTTFKQSVDYRYNIRGWLTSINNADLTPASTNEDDSNYGKDLFGMELAYEKPITDLTTIDDVQYNGNISAITYSNNQALGAIKSNGYKYGYDPMNRLKEAQFRQKNTTWGLSSYNGGNNQVLTAQAYSETGFDYDLNGNINKLKRSGAAGSQQMDDLKYAYEGNRLLSVTDEGDASKGFIDGNVSGDDYQYDVNGNMIVDANKGIAAITYNYLNLPEKVTKTTGDYIKYSYDASGRKLSQQVYDPSHVLKKKSDYAGEYFYENDTLKFINHEEGRVVMNHNTTTGDNLLADPVEGSTQGFPINQDVTITSETREGEPYIHVVSNSNGTTSGVQPLSGGAIACLPGETYTFSVKGFAVSASPVVLYVGMGNTNYDFVWPGPSFASGAANERWTTVTYTIPAGQTEMRLGVLFTSSNIGDEFYITAVSLKKNIQGIEPEYQYHLKDHLGNVRATFTTKDEVDESKATYETANAGTEQSKFLNQDKVRYINHPFYDHTKGKSSPSSEGDFAQRLSGSAQEKIGLAKSISVMPGDKLDIEVFAKYYEPIPDDQSPFATLMNSIINGMAVPAGTIIDGAGYALGANSSLPFTDELIKSGINASAPKAYLNWAVFNRDYVLNLDKSGFAQITTAAREDGSDVNHVLLETLNEIIIDEPGFVYIWLSNENENPVEVYFDDFKINHTKSPIIQQEEYYPFGLTFNNYQRENNFLNKWKFQGQEHVDELGLNWDSFKWRNHQPDIGRFFNVDPLSEKYYYNSVYAFSENKVVAHFELEGLESVHFTIRPVHGGFSTPRGFSTSPIWNQAGSVDFSVDLAKGRVSNSNCVNGCGTSKGPTLIKNSDGSISISGATKFNSDGLAVFDIKLTDNIKADKSLNVESKIVTENKAPFEIIISDSKGGEANWGILLNTVQQTPSTTTFINTAPDTSEDQSNVDLKVHLLENNGDTFFSEIKNAEEKKFKTTTEFNKQKEKKSTIKPIDNN